MEAKAREHEVLFSKCSGKEALDHAIAAAEIYMKAARESTNAVDKKRLQKKCEGLIMKAEELKKSMKTTTDSVSAIERRLKLPRQVRQIPTSEKTLLYRNSRLHGNVFPPWEADPDPAEFTGKPYSDNSSFSLSERQMSVFAGWKRPLDLVSKRVRAENTTDDFLMEAKDDFDLVQDITTDCSVVASLCASIKHLRPGRNSILPILMFPADQETGQPKISTSGKYIFRMFFNGCFRKVIIDDYLPSSSNERTLYVVDRQNPGLIWPALVEKAYLKVRGGYDFPGSNSGTDLCVLTGWIPQQLFLQSDDVDWDATWRRVKKAYDYGDVVVTLGTGRLSPDEEEILGLAGEHDYAVLDMSESAGNRMLLVKNPWCDGLVWKGVGSSTSSINSETDEHPVRLKPGSFWISFDDVTQNFESLYLNWNPSLFTERQDHHFVWQPPDASMIGSFADNPQYSMTAQADDQTWILLSRHFQDEELEISRKRSTTLAAVSNMLGFTSLYIFAHANGKRVQLSDKSVYRGPFVDSPQTLAPFEAKKGVKYTIVVASQDLPLPKYSFTLSFFSRTPLAISPAQQSLRYYTEVQSAWTRRTSGGNSASLTYLTNPQFSITLTATGPLSILLSTAKDDLPVHVDLVWARGQRVTAVSVRDLVASSGDYRRGCALASAPSVEKGTYTVVCSTFEPGQLADFTLRVGSDSPGTRVVPVPADAAGRLRTQLSGLSFRGGEYKKRAAVSVARLTRACVVVTRKGGGGSGQNYYSSSTPPPPPSSSFYRPTTTGAVPSSNHQQQQQQQRSNHHPTVRVTVESGRGPNREILASTSSRPTMATPRIAGSKASSDDEGGAGGGEGEFRQVTAGAGLRTPDFDIDPRALPGLWLVVEQMSKGDQQAAATGDAENGGGGGGGHEHELQVEVFSDGDVRVGGWETVD
ncbi:hypothetical protein F5X96DRAFT_463455 [Biscogniauxia mediterranea]|nr:hypothetical protein F5X96DRAFT_463455 [Biscogniauxia mediterranea]